MIKKKVMALLLCIVMLVSVGCSGKSDVATNTDAKKDNVIRIVYPTSRAMGDKDISKFQEWFADNFPDAELEMVSSAVTTASDSVVSEFKNNNGPDIFVTTEYDRFVQAGYFADITGMPVLTRYRKSCVRGLERDGKVYALPLGGGVLIALHYNKTLFDEYGIEYPKSTESLYDVVLRIDKVIKENDLDKSPVGASLLYPSQVSAVINATMAETTQTDKYLEWITDYGMEGFSFDDDIFQNYLEQLQYMLVASKDKDGNNVPDTGKLFHRDDYFSTQASAITSFLNGASFMFIGDVTRTYSTYGTEGSYDKSDIAVMGIPVGIKGVDYLSYMDELYLGVNSQFDTYSDRKKEIIEEVLDYISSPEIEARNIFTYTGDYCSVYLEGESVERNQDMYFKEINNSLDQNFIAQEVNNTPFSSIFGKIILAWKKGELGDIVEGDGTDIEKITTILDAYYNSGENMFAKSEAPIGRSKYFMEYQSNIVRSRETAIGNQIADMTRDYMNADFALVNAGGIRASVPEGEISAQTLNSILPYENYLVNIKVSGATLKKAIQNAYNVGPIYKLGKFGAISGLRVSLETNPVGYSEYEQKLNEWSNSHKNASEIEKNSASKEIVEAMCDENSDILNLKVLSVTDLEGNPIEDDKIYTVATIDYLLKGGDDFSMLAILAEETNPEADTSIEVYDREGNLIQGTPEEMLHTIEDTCDKGADAFVNWVTAGNELESQVDGRIEIKNFIYVE